MTIEVIGEPIIINNKIIPLSKAVRAGDFVFLSGQLGCNADMIFPKTVGEQTKLSVMNIKAVLIECGLTLANIVKTTVWLTKREYFQEFNQAYEEHFPDKPPCRSTVCSALMVPSALVEIEAIAYHADQS